MTAIQLERRRPSKLLLLCIVFAVAIVIPWQLGISEHERERHGSESYTPSDIKQRMKDWPYEIWLSEARDQQLYLVWMGVGDIWGGRIIGATDPQPITSFARPRAMWDKIILRDGYIRVR